MKAPPFTLSRPCIGLGNRDRYNAATFGQCEVKAGPWQFTAYVSADGDVNLPGGLADQDLRRCIAAAVRTLILEETHDRWGAVTRREATSK